MLALELTAVTAEMLALSDTAKLIETDELAEAAVDTVADTDGTGIDFDAD